LPRRIPAPVPAQWSGQCVGVSDGDTIKVMLYGKAQTIRLFGIDCPEKKQAFGTRAKQYTSSLVFGKAVTIYSKGSDRYGRVLGWVFVGGRCINADLVSSGLAWWYRQYSPNEAKLAQLEATSRAAKLGLWADAAPVPPWEYRHPKRS
jgi:endonuclease YncB( thermonuclease family)